MSNTSVSRSAAIAAGTLASLIFIFGCANKAPRTPSAESAGPTWAQTMEADYQNLLNSQDPQKEFRDMFDRLSKLSARSTGLVREFDQQLAESYKKFKSSGAKPQPGTALEMFNSETYLKIHAAEEIARQTENRLMFMYDHLYQDAAKALQEGRKDDYRRLNQIRQNIHGAISERSQSADIFAMESTLGSIREYLVAQASTQAFQTVSSGGEVQKFDRAFNNQFLDSSAKIQSVLKKYGEDLNEKVKDASADSQLDAELQRETDIIKRDLAALALDPSRQPAQSRTLYPATNSNGNIVGGSFPKGHWVLTYDDGPHSVHTKTIMQTLERNGYRATFFWLGQNVANPNLASIVEYGKKMGHTLANHSQTHINFGAVREDGMGAAIQDEIIRPETIMTRAYGYKPKFYRCPYGACTRVMPVRQSLADRGYLHAFWAVDSLDWNKGANPNGPIDIVRRVQQQMEMRGQGVILFHDIHPQSAAATEMLIPTLKQLEARGGRVISLCEAVDMTNGDPANTFCRR